jgi:glycosyltransferase involved in cell wall biosynthesis
MMSTLALCMIVKNEAHNLARCLDSVGALVSEVIVVDTGSADATPEIAANYGARVLPFDFTRPDFAAARNYGLAHATAGWILVLDADEILDPASGSRIAALATGDANIGYYLERHNGGHRDYVVRLFPNRMDYRFKGRVHETIDASILAAGGRLHQTSIRIHHNFALARRERNFRYIEILKEELAAEPGDTTRLDFLAAEYHQLGMFQEASLIAEHLAQIRPQDARAQLFAGVYHLLYQPNPPMARARLQRALELRPGDPETMEFIRQLNPAESLSRP